MPFINAGAAFSTLHGFRMVWLPGAFGNGKTALAVALYAQYFLPRGYKLISNLQTVWTEPDLSAIQLDPDTGHLKVFVLIDEGGQYFTGGAGIRELLRNPRKLDYILCFPSFHAPHRTAQIFQIQPIWSYRSAGIPLINYRWSANVGHSKFSGNFQWAFFQEVYGLYSSGSPAGSPGAIREFLDRRNAEYIDKWGYDADDRILAAQDGGGGGGQDNGSGLSGGFMGRLDSIDGELASLSAQADVIETLSARKSRRR